MESVRAILGLKYPQFEVIVIDDGSLDLREAVPAIEHDIPTRGAVRSVHVPEGSENLTVTRKVNAGRRADALNVGLNAARFPLVCMVDADSLLDPDALLRVVQPFIDDPDRVVGTGGAIRALVLRPGRRGLSRSRS